jgi:CsoR family transcriptional regulator, copper-sensing transcriptional repressor
MVYFAHASSRPRAATAPMAEVRAGVVAVATRSEQERLIKDRLARIEGQVRGIQRMIDEGRACDDILTQVLAARTALERTAGEIVGTYIEECMTAASPEEARSRLARTVKLLTRVS